MRDPNPPPAPILIVDDDPDVLSVLTDQLRVENYEVIPASSASEALDLLRARPFSVIISDQRMPEMLGLEFLAQARRIRPLASRVLITGVLSLDTVINAINQGEIFRFIAKPWIHAELLATVSNAMQRYQLTQSNETLLTDTAILNRKLAAANEELEAKLSEVEKQKRALDVAHHALRENFDHSIELCYRMMGTFYPLLGAHTKAVVDICRKMVETERFSEEEKHVLITSAWLHDIGLIGFKRELLHKLNTYPDQLTRDEQTLLRNHPIYGQTLASFVDQLTAVGTTIRAHHERFDGRGYPDGLAGENIPWTARCLAVVVFFVECTLPKEAAHELVLKHSGFELDPEAVRLFFKVSNAADLPRSIREVMVDELQPGMRLARGIYSPAGMLLIPEGQPLNPSTIVKIKNHNMLTSVTQRLLVYS